MNTRRAAAVGSAAVVLLGGGVAVAAGGHGGPGNRGGSHSSPQGQQAPQGFGGGAFQHGQFVSGSTAKGFTTYDVQNGTVTAYAAGSTITVTSADGYATTYAITSSTRTQFPRDRKPHPRPSSSASATPTASASPTAKTVAVGDSVSVTAKVVDGTADATSINDQGIKKVKATPSASATS